MQNNPQYSFWQSAVKTAVRVFLVIAPALFAHIPSTWLNLTLGGSLMLAFDWLKAKYTTL